MNQPPLPPQHWFPMIPAAPPPSSSFWNTNNVRYRLVELLNTIDLAKAMEKELEALISVRDSEGSLEGIGLSLSEFLEANRIDVASQESLSLRAANDVIAKLGAQLEPFRVAADESSQWEEKSVAVRFANRVRKSIRNKRWRKRKRKMVAERLAEERERFDQADQEADEWRAREIAKDIAKRKVERMKEIAKVKAREEKKRLESELELVLIVEKLQELRTLRIQKLKKQGHFLPEEDDKFLERVRAAVEEEERLATAAANTEATKDAIANAEESRNIIQGHGPDSVVKEANESENVDDIEHMSSSDKRVSDAITGLESGRLGQTLGGAYDSVSNLPIEFYHYYHGSNNDLGTLIEVRRTWDQYIRPGGTRIPGHWVQPPPPADETWASYLARPR